MYLLDTNVLFASAPGRPQHTPALVRWMHEHSPELFLSVVTVTEITAGVARLERTGSSAKAVGLRQWIDLVMHLYGSRILPFGVKEARLAGELTDRARSAGRVLDFADVAIAATAASYDLTVLTRNVRDFAPLGVPVVDPFDTLP